MSTWRKKAIEISPEDKHDFQDPDTSIYLVFGYLRERLYTAHKSNNREKIKQIYDFAEWCFNQTVKDIWNAAGVSFYEHLPNDELVFSHFTEWIPKNIYLEIRGLLELRTTEQQLKALDKYYNFNALY